ncbi:DUF2637 domain-containing protein [Rothia nasimurium]|uniref:DUF2637 domain-containing protein n=1 Tax=Rothia nasimurium TaxID=85336 RepID=UPI001F19BF5D|nr:DUF2637 domain-containing protein [Rothia nasimurium]
MKSIKNQTRINPDSRPMLWVTVLLVFMLGLTSFMVSFNGLHDVAGWVGLPTWMRWTVPIFIDIAILAYSMAAVIHRTRGEPVALTWATLAVFTLISVIANGAHALAVGEGQTALQSWIGAAIAAAAPLSVFAATEELSRLAFGTDEPAQVQSAATVDEEQMAVIRELTSYQEPDRSEPIEQQLPATLEENPETEPSSAEPLPEAVAPAETEPEELAEVAVASTVTQAHEGNEDPDFDVLRPWIQEQIQQGKRITGAKAGELIGKSSRTGLNKINALRQSEPALFTGE